MAREKQLKIGGFPNFATAVQELQQAQDLPSPEYEVCLPLADGHLAIKENLVTMWTEKHEEFASEARELLSRHNRKYNPRGVKRGAGAEVEQGSASMGGDTKRLRLDTTAKASSHESSLGNTLLDRFKEPFTPLSLHVGGKHVCKPT